MPVFYKFSSDGQKVYIVKTMFSKNILEDEYFNRAKQLPVEEFLAKFDEKTKNKLREEIGYLSELNNKLIRVSKKCHKESIGNHRVIFEINSDIFKWEKSEENKAAQYVKEKYGEDFYDEWYKNFILEQDEKEIFYIKTKEGIKQLTDIQVNQIEKTIKSLTKINSIDNLFSKKGR